MSVYAPARIVSLLFSVHHLCFHISFTFYVGLLLKTPLKIRAAPFLHVRRSKVTSSINTSSTFSEGNNLSLLNFYCNISTSLLWSSFFFPIPLTLPHSHSFSKYQIFSLLPCIYSLYWLSTALVLLSSAAGIQGSSFNILMRHAFLGPGPSYLDSSSSSPPLLT